VYSEDSPELAAVPLEELIPNPKEGLFPFPRFPPLEVVPLIPKSFKEGALNTIRRLRSNSNHPATRVLLEW